MSIKKRDCMDFLEAVEWKARTSVKERYSTMIEELKLVKLDPYMDKIESFQKQINSITKNVDSLILNMSEDLEIAYNTGRYRSLESHLKELIGTNAKDLIIHNCEFKGEVTLIENKRDTELKEVTDNYNKVKQVCNRLPSGNKVAEYLKGLGFDIASLEKGEDLSLVANIDKSKLFVCGDNK